MRARKYDRSMVELTAKNKRGEKLVEDRNLRSNEDYRRKKKAKAKVKVKREEQKTKERRRKEKFDVSTMTYA